MKNVKYVKLTNAKWIKCFEAQNKITLDGELLNPIKGEHFSPFLATAFLPKNFETFHIHQRMRKAAAIKFWPQINNLLIHLERKNWQLFDKQFLEFELNEPINTERERIVSAFKVVELNGKFFSPPTNIDRQRVRQRIVLAKNISSSLMKDLASFFQTKGKDDSNHKALLSIRDRWSSYYGFLSPIFNTFYWDDKKHNLEDFTITEKRFHDLKQFFVDCFETFCRISVIAGGIEGIIHQQKIGIPLNKRLMPIEEFDVSHNGAKPDLLKQTVIGDIFVPFIDSNLRNGIGHSSAHFDVKSDSITYVTENSKGQKHFKISYVRFCEKVVVLYGQLEAVSIYAHWLKKASMGVDWP